MLPRSLRLTRQRDFLRVYKKGVSLACPAFVLHRKANGAAGARFGFSVSKKVGNAVLRNRVKRRLRHAVYANRELFAPGCDYICVARSACADISYDQLTAQLKSAAVRLASPDAPQHRRKAAQKRS